jgi:cullin 3
MSQNLVNIANDVDFDKTWGVLAASLQEIHTKNASELSFEELYRNAYRLVLKKMGETLYENVKGLETTWLADTVRVRILGLITKSLPLENGGNTGSAGPNERRVAGEKLMRGLRDAWEDHNLCMNMTTDVLMYMVNLPVKSSVFRIEFCL